GGARRLPGRRADQEVPGPGGQVQRYSDRIARARARGVENASDAAVDVDEVGGAAAAGVHGQREVLVGGRADAVAGGDDERIGTGGASGWRTAERGCAVAVVDEGDPARQCPRL